MDLVLAIAIGVVLTVAASAMGAVIVLCQLPFAARLERQRPEVWRAWVEVDPEAAAALPLEAIIGAALPGEPDPGEPDGTCAQGAPGHRRQATPGPGLRLPDRG